MLAAATHLLLVDLEGLCQRFLQSLGDGADVLCRLDVLCEHAELVAAETGEHVARAKLGVQPPGDRLQESIAGHVAVRVVDGLEAIEVDEQDGVAGRRSAARLRNRTLDELAEQRSIRQIGQRIVLCRLRERIPDAALLGDVGL